MNKKKFIAYKNVFVIVPAYNEESLIRFVVESIVTTSKRYTCVVIDDGSTDQTYRIAKSSGAIVLRHRTNLGSGIAVQHGLKYALQKKADAIVIIDADGQHDARFIPDLLEQLQNGHDYIIASRYIKKTPRSTEWLRSIATKYISIVLKKTVSIRVFDPTSGYRAMNATVCRYLCGKYPFIFPEPEIVLLLKNTHFSLAEVSIPMNRRLYGKSSITFVKGLYLLWYISRKSILTGISLFFQKQI